ncbi:MAG: cobyric acid synthase [Dehalococcoidales bacterium]|nr:cobyric acid synthase [Dehalococcoidales bacterium]
MIQGTASAVGKSIIVTALCRIFKQDGYKVAPFKSQNIALNSFVTEGGGEIGRAQAVQAEAAGITATVKMNPILLKPTSNSGCQVVLLGRVDRNIAAQDYTNYAPALLKTVTGSLEKLRAEYEIVVIEGAGSTAEINLKDREIVNMRIAKASDSPVLLVGDIDKGGVFASLVGTLELLDRDEQRYVKGMIINKFRGDVSLLKPAIDFTEKRTGLPLLGVVPYFQNIRIAQEDSVYLDEREKNNASGGLNVTVIRLPHISNYDDFDPLEEECTVSYIRQRFEMGNPHLIIIPGTKSTINDLQYLRQSGLADLIMEKAAAGTPIVGICGGYQMLGRKILDPQRVESDRAEVEGLGLLDIVTEFADEKSTRQVKAIVTSDTGLLAGAKGQAVSGYEIHMGQSQTGEQTPAFRIIETPQGKTDYADGVLNKQGTVLGTYMHGLFNNDDFRQFFLNNLRRHWGLHENKSGARTDRDREYDKLADVVRQNLDMKKIYRIMEAGV